MEEQRSTRIYGEPVNIVQEQVKELYANRVETRGQLHVDAPTILSGDTDVKNIELWTQEEMERWFPKFRLDNNCVVFEIGFGTGRMTKYITSQASQYVGIDYVEKFKKVVLNREDIIKTKNTEFYTISLEDFLSREQKQYKGKFNRVFLSGGVFMYINDNELQRSIQLLLNILQDNCVVYISEPIAIEERLTLDAFYSDTIKDTYSAIYRTEEEYMELFKPFMDAGFSLKQSQEFFENDIKHMKETKQWIFILER